MMEKPYPQTTTQDLAQIRYDVEKFLLEGDFELYENQRFIAEMKNSQAQIELLFGKLILSSWGDGWSRSWRILSAEISPNALRFQCAKQLGRVECLVEMQRHHQQGEIAGTRQEFAQSIGDLIEANFPEFKVIKTITQRNDPRHFSSIHTRLLIRENHQRYAAVAIGSNESSSHVDATLSAGLIWLDHLRQTGNLINRLMLLVPAGRAFTIASRLVYVQIAGIPISLFEIGESQRMIKPISSFAQADLFDNLKRASQSADWSHGKPLNEGVQNFLANLQEQTLQPIDTRRRNGWVYLAIHGLTFARIAPQKLKVEFGISLPRKKLSDKNYPELLELIAGISHMRTADARAFDDLRFRLQGERWLESLLRQAVTAIDPTLDGRFVYSQVPAYRGEQRSYIDLLTATRTGRLVVIELKISEDAEFPFQGLDYWIRIDWHRRRGDFERRGYFKGLAIQDAPPLLYLVAPLFRFHATTKLIAESISKEVPLYRIGINENWRSGAKRLLYERLNEAPE
ncbi:MAG: hypothetical protein AB1757_10430 [Acidobacteriota bacterium]